MLLDVSMAIKSEGEEFPFLHRDEIPPQEIFGDTVTFEDVLMSGFYSLEGKALRLRGTLETTARGRCAACLNPVALPIRVEFDESFRHMDRREALAERAKDTDDAQGLEEERLAFEGSKVELSHLALTLAVLELPMRFLCDPPCDAMKALQEDNPTHACQKELPDQHPFSALQQLLTKDQEV